MVSFISPVVDPSSKDDDKGEDEIENDEEIARRKLWVIVTFEKRMIERY